MHLRRSKKVYALTMTAAAAAVLGAVSPWTVPVGPVPLSFCTLLLYLMPWILDWKGTVAATGVYLAMGAAGLPVFSGFMGGLGHLAGPTGGYLVGYLFLTALCALFVTRAHSQRWVYLIGMLLGTAVLYAMGTAWFCIQTGRGAAEAFVLCVVPFLPGDLVKMLAAFILGPVLRNRLKRTGLLNT